jgi:hypothetical protein
VRSGIKDSQNLRDLRGESKTHRVLGAFESAGGRASVSRRGGGPPQSGCGRQMGERGARNQRSPSEMAAVADSRSGVMSPQHARRLT